MDTHEAPDTIDILLDYIKSLEEFVTPDKLEKLTPKRDQLLNVLQNQRKMIRDGQEKISQLESDISSLQARLKSRKASDQSGSNLK